ETLPRLADFRANFIGQPHCQHFSLRHSNGLRSAFLSSCSGRSGRAPLRAIVRALCRRVVPGLTRFAAAETADQYQAQNEHTNAKLHTSSLYRLIIRMRTEAATPNSTSAFG